MWSLLKEAWGEGSPCSLFLCHANHIKHIVMEVSKKQYRALTKIW